MNIVELHPLAWSKLLAQRSRPAHAILLSGPPGLDKTALANAFAASLLCESPLDSGSCGACLACNWLSQGYHPDFRIVCPDAEANENSSGDSGGQVKSKASREIRIEQVRALEDFLNIGTHRAGHRVVLVAPAEAMNRNTANALLKSLEEPAPGTVFILVTSHSDALLPTLRSRCLQFSVPTPERHLGARWLHDHGIAEGTRWLDLAGGAPRLALSIARGSEGELVNLIQSLFSPSSSFDSRRAAADVEKLLRAKDDLEMDSVVSWIQRWLVDEALLQRNLPARYFAERRKTDHTDDRILFKINKKLVEFKKLSQHTLNTRLFLESLFDTCGVLMPTGSR